MPTKGHYSVATAATPQGPFTIVHDYPNSVNFSCGGSQGDFDILVDDDGEAFIVITYYSHFCIERLNKQFTGGTGETTTIVSMDPTIKGHPDGDEAPALFKRDGGYFLTYASGCCGCKGGSITWQHRAPYVTFRLNFHHFDRFELDLRGHTQVRGAAFPCLRLKLADIVLI